MRKQTAEEQKGRTQHHHHHHSHHSLLRKHKRKQTGQVNQRAELAASHKSRSSFLHPAGRQSHLFDNICIPSKTNTRRDARVISARRSSMLQDFNHTTHLKMNEASRQEAHDEKNRRRRRRMPTRLIVFLSVVWVSSLIWGAQCESRRPDGPARVGALSGPPSSQQVAPVSRPKRDLHPSARASSLIVSAPTINQANSNPFGPANVGRTNGECCLF